MIVKQSLTLVKDYGPDEDISVLAHLESCCLDFEALSDVCALCSYFRELFASSKSVIYVGEINQPAANRHN